MTKMKQMMSEDEYLRSGRLVQSGNDLEVAHYCLRLERREAMQNSRRANRSTYVRMAIDCSAPGVTRKTPGMEALSRLIDYTAIQMVEQYGLPPGWTHEEFIASHIDTAAGSWVGLAIAMGLPGVTRRTPKAKACAILIDRALAKHAQNGTSTKITQDCHRPDA